jgi:hypothetical protein
MSILEEPAVRVIAEKLDAKFMEISAGFARTGNAGLTSTRVGGTDGSAQAGDGIQNAGTASAFQLDTAK